MNRLLSATLLLSLIAAALAGCSTTQSWVSGDEDEAHRPTSKTCPDAQAQCPDTERVVALGVTDHIIEHAHRRAHDAMDATSSDDSQPTPRRPGELSDVIADEPIDPSAGHQVADDDDELEAFEDEDGPLQAFAGYFDDPGSTVTAVVLAGERLEFRRDDQAIASLALDDFDPHLPDDDSLPISAGAVDLVNGDQHQLMLLHRQSDEDGAETYILTIHKIIAGRVGTIFSEPIAKRQANGELTQTLDIRFLHGTDDRVIELIELDPQGQPVGEPKRLEWNQWEGLYRMPSSPPTAPDDPVAERQWLGPIDRDLVAVPSQYQARRLPGAQ